LTLGSFKSAFFIAYFLLEISNFVAEGELATVFYLLEYDKFGSNFVLIVKNKIRLFQSFPHQNGGLSLVA
jgi:hypothetical protein